MAKTSKGILVLGDLDQIIKSRADRFRLSVEVSKAYSIPFDKTLIVESGIKVPWDLLPAAWSFLERWDAAVPLWRYGVTAADLGTGPEREITQEISGDLRVLVYSHELLFIRKNETGERLLQQWLAEMERGPDRRLAFLRAFHIVKPRLCTLPISWLADVRGASRIQSERGRSSHPRIGRMKQTRLVRVQIGPNRFVRCAPGDEQRVIDFYNEKAGN